MANHIDEEFMAACYNVIEQCHNAFLTCRDLELCKRTDAKSCMYEVQRALGSCGLVIESCRTLIARAELHLTRCDIPACSQRTQDALDVCDRAITECNACIQDCLVDGARCAHFSEQSALACVEVGKVVQKIIDNL